MTLLAALCLAIAGSLLPDPAFANPWILGASIMLALVLGGSWLLLFGLHLVRMILRRGRAYSLGWIIVILFVPFVGPAWASLRMPRVPRP